jgi:DNA primase
MAGTFVDFAALKEALTIAQVVDMLGLKMKGNDQMRSSCPQCRTGGERALAVNITKASFYCFSDGKGGDLISLTAHIRGCSQREAAQELAEHFRIAQPKQEEAPKPQATTTAGGGMKPLDGLEHDHPAVEAVGFDPTDAEALGIGFCSKGIMRGLVAVPIRLENGDIAGYLGLNDIAKLPPQWRIPTTNVVPLKKTSA